MIKRLFHPIGQGAFYSESHENFNIVCDCGNWKNTKLSDKVVEQSFDKNDIIDILFISHFDFDHISKIPKLKRNVKNIKRVVLPLLHKNEKILLTNIYRIIYSDFSDLINNPQEYFGDKTKIINVIETNNGESSLSEIDTPEDIDKIKKGNNDKMYKIKSGKSIFINDPNWIFIPYNHKYKIRNSPLIKALKKEGFNINKLQINSKYTLSKIATDLKIKEKETTKKIKRVYDRLDGRINQNSMLLYSGPKNTRIFKNHCFCGNNLYSHCYPFLHNRCLNNKIACIYTGDTDLNIVKIESIFKPLWNNVGTIQVPHHGDIKSFNFNILNYGQYRFPISFGTNNSYGHPSAKVVSKILNNKNFPIFITEKLDSMFIECIDHV